MMEFIKVSSPERVVDYLAGQINERLESGDSVFWLLSGGSAIAIAVETAKRLKPAKLAHLSVSLADERYGPNGHSDSNWQQLMDAGFSLDGALLQPVLIGKDLSQTTRHFGEIINSGLKSADYSIGLFGIGTDGHTSGILPGSPGVDSADLVLSYPAADYGQRITTTAKAIEKLDEAVVYAVGDSKKQPLDDLQQELTAARQPAQILKQVKKVTVFNDYIGGDA